MHRLARDNHARHAVGALGPRQLDLRQAVSVGRDGAQRLRLAGLSGVQIDAVQIIARLFRRNGKARLLDEALQIRAVNGELVTDFAGSEIGEVFRRQVSAAKSATGPMSASGVPCRHRA